MLSGFKVCRFCKQKRGHTEIRNTVWFIKEVKYCGFLKNIVAGNDDDFPIAQKDSIRFRYYDSGAIKQAKESIKDNAFLCNWCMPVTVFIQTKLTRMLLARETTLNSNFENFAEIMARLSKPKWP